MDSDKQRRCNVKRLGFDAAGVSEPGNVTA